MAPEPLDVAVDEDRRRPDADRDATRAGCSSTTACSRPATASSTRWARRCSTSTSRGRSSRAAATTCSRRRCSYEQVGDVPNVVFPCAALVDRDADRLTIYYGGADTVVCLAHGHLSEILEFVRGDDRDEQPTTPHVPAPRASFMSANYVAEELGYGAATEWGPFDDATNAAFEPLETFAARFDALLARITAIGFDTIDLWFAHLNWRWATPDHVAIAREALARRTRSRRQPRRQHRRDGRRPRSRVPPRERPRRRSDRRRRRSRPQRSRRGRGGAPRRTACASGSRTTPSGRRERCSPRSATTPTCSARRSTPAGGRPGIRPGRGDRRALATASSTSI